MRTIEDVNKGCVVDIDFFHPEDEEPTAEDNLEQNLEKESIEMLQSWDLPLPKQAQFERINDDEPALYYDSVTSFNDLSEEMKRLEGGKVFVKVLESNPDGVEIKADRTIVFDRIGFLEFNPIPFECSIQDGKPSVLNMSEGPILPGLLQGLLSLRQGERASILIHPALAYGPHGAPPLIPRDSFLFYHVKIYKVFEESDMDAAFRFEKDLHQIVPLQEKMRLMREHKDSANKYLKENQPREALTRYKAAIKWAQEEDEQVKATDREWRDLIEILYQNTAITYNMMNMPKAATKAAKCALVINPQNIKACFQLAKARLSMGDNAGALRAAERAHELDKQNVSINNLRLHIDTIFREEKSKREEIFKKMSKAFV